MKCKIEQLDEKTVDNFWRLRKELFLELGEVSNEMDISELKSATEQYYLSHIKRLWLSSSEQGKRLYAGKEFIKKNEMELFL